MSRTRAIFKNMVIATAGPMPDQFTDEKLKLWTEQRKGTFSKEWNDTVTHLLCTTDQFRSRRKNIRIKGALMRKREVHVVHVDWYDFSCARKKKLSEREFSFDKILQKEREKIRKQKAAEQAAKNLALGEYFINPSCYRTFIDKFHFEYDIELFRTTTDEFGTYHERYTLTLYQSYATPRLYWFAVKFAKKQDSGSWRPSGVARPSECSGPFKPEFTKFKDLFRRLTGLDWPDRIIRAGTTDSTRFQYSPPTRGKPVGGNLALGFTVEESFALNRELRRDFCSLFGDEPEVTEEDKAIIEVVREVFTCLMREVVPFEEQASSERNQLADTVA